MSQLQYSQASQASSQSQSQFSSQSDLSVCALCRRSESEVDGDLEGPWQFPFTNPRRLYMHNRCLNYSKIDIIRDSDAIEKLLKDAFQSVRVASLCSITHVLTLFILSQEMLLL
mmetsp:Transcript_4696/g.7296  ORF Transcript_4696/g.7296 Transcript_4696/m.7296 type:complete len:114 (+) Transcript_4696:152-493(+)